MGPIGTAPAGPPGAVPGDAAPAPSTGSERYLTFALGGESFALPILDITEIMEFRSLTTVPMMPAFIRGVINLRGRVVPVVDMSLRFGRGETEIGRRTSIIIVDPNARRSPGDGGPRAQAMGIVVDAVNKVMHLTTDDVEPPPEFGAGIRTDFISGMARSDGQFIIVLDVSHVLLLDERAMVDRAASVRPRDRRAGEGRAPTPDTAGAGAPTPDTVPSPRQGTDD